MPPVAEAPSSCIPQGYRQLKAFIATQAPLPSTVEDLWQMVWEQETRSLVALTTTQEIVEQVRRGGEGRDVEGRGGKGRGGVGREGEGREGGEEGSGGKLRGGKGRGREMEGRGGEGRGGEARGEEGRGGKGTEGKGERREVEGRGREMERRGGECHSLSWLPWGKVVCELLKAVG